MQSTIWINFDGILRKLQEYITMKVSENYNPIPKISLSFLVVMHLSISM